ncbi:MAG: methyltransferase domain-containing protein [Acidimicrobiales bacterium]
MNQRQIKLSTWEYYDRRVSQGVPGLQRALDYWSGLGVPVVAGEIEQEAACVREHLASLSETTFVEVAAGPGTFTGFLPGREVASDQSAAALARLRADHPTVPAIRADVTTLPFRDRSFGRYFAAHIYGLLQPDERRTALDEGARVAAELVVLDAGRPPGVAAEQWQDRTLPDGGHYRIYRRHFEPEVLASELGGSVLFGGSFYVLVRVTDR